MDQGSSHSPRSPQNNLLDNQAHRIIYYLEVAKHLDDLTKGTVDQELQQVLKGLSYMPGFMFEKDVAYAEFLNRVRSEEMKRRSQGLWDVPHPWLDLFNYPNLG
ncbi:hypothetical protein PTKIN_Ptkin07bG0044000 [Pterospermum kingtungense]